MPASADPRADTATRLSVACPPARFFDYYPGTVAVVTAAHAGDRNVMSAGWHAALSAQPPLYGVALGRGRYTYELVIASRAFAVHFLPFDHARTIAAVGSTSRRTGVDKFALFGLEAAPGAKLDVPILQDAYLAYECRVSAVHETGDHDWIVGEVVAVHHGSEAFDDRGLQDGGAVPGTVYYGRSTYEALGAGRKHDYSPETFGDEPLRK